MKPKKAPKAPTSKARANTHAFILLDRTGSMGMRWDEAVSSVNAYIDEIRKVGGAKVTLAAFDSHEGTNFDILRNALPAADCPELRKDEVYPRGSTPLFDAIMRLLGLAQAARPSRAAFVVMTDGEENASSEVRREDVKKALDKVKAKGWQTIFLGVDFDAFPDASKIGVFVGYIAGTSSSSSVYATRTIARHSAAYLASGHNVALVRRKYGNP